MDKKDMTININGRLYVDLENFCRKFAEYLIPYDMHGIITEILGWGEDYNIAIDKLVDYIGNFQRYGGLEEPEMGLRIMRYFVERRYGNWLKANEEKV